MYVSFYFYLNLCKRQKKKKKKITKQNKPKTTTNIESRQVIYDGNPSTEVKNCANIPNESSVGQ